MSDKTLRTILEKRVKTLKILIIVFTIVGLVLLGLGIAMPYIIQSLMMQQIREQAVMSESNYQQWAEVPGSLGALVFTNPYDVLFFGQKPVFQEVGPFSYQEWQNFTNRQYLDDGNLVNFEMWYHYTQLDKLDHNVKIPGIVNFGAFGAWWQVKNAQKYQLAQQALGQIVSGMNSLTVGIKPVIYASGFPTFLFPKKDASLYSMFGGDASGLTEAQVKAIYYEPYYGFSTSQTLNAWYMAAENGLYSESALFLADYFSLTMIQIQPVINQLSTAMQTINSTILQTFYCQDNETMCTPQYLSALQFSSEGVTMNQPAGLKGFPSIFSNNNTVFGTPEISYYYKQNFLKNVNNTAPFQNLVFDTEWASEVLETNGKAYPNQVQTECTLLHKGNLVYLFNQMEGYEQTWDENQIKPVMTRFKLKTIQHAYVLYKYVEYLATDFAAFTNLGGTSAHAGLGNFFSESLYSSFFQAQDLKNLIQINMLKQKYTTCESILSGVSEATPSVVTAFCNMTEMNPYTDQSIRYTMLVCLAKEGPQWQSVKTVTGLKDGSLLQLCGEAGFFGNQITVLDAEMAKLYDCELSTRCSKMEIAIKQWIDSSITNNPPKGCTLPKTNSSKDWIPQVGPWEYGLFKLTFPTIPNVNLTYKQAQYYLSYNCTFQGTLIARLWVASKSNDTAFLKQYFPDFPNYDSVLYYFRYVIIEIAFSGYVQSRSPYEMLFGYTDPFLKQMATLDPSLGGDPSIPYTVLLNQNFTSPAECEGETYQQAMYTGKNDSSLIRTYQSITGSTHMVAQIPQFDGNKTSILTFNPWNIEAPVNQGTDALTFRSGLSSSSPVGVTITDLARSGEGGSTGQNVDYWGLDTMRYTVGPSFYAVNPDYNNYKYSGLVNLTTVKTAPILFSYTHFYKADTYLQEAIVVYNKDGNIQEPNQADDVKLDVEPNTGIVILAILNLQANFELTSDELFPKANYALLPIMSLFRGGNWTEDMIQSNLGAVMTAIKLKQVLFIVGVAVGCLLVVVSVALFILRKKYMKRLESQFDDYPNEQQNSLIENKI